MKNLAHATVSSDYCFQKRKNNIRGRLEVAAGNGEVPKRVQITEQSTNIMYKRQIVFSAIDSNYLET